MALIAGIDIGTTSVKICLLDVIKQTIVTSNRTIYDFKVNQKIECGEESRGYCQQNVPDIIDAIHNCILKFDVHLRHQIKVISICGQMHGVVLWDNKTFYNYNEENGDFKINTSVVSDLYNWQDNRCSDNFLRTLPQPDSIVDRISSGFGCATIFWLNFNSKDLLSQFNSSGTIMDFVVSILCDLKKPIMGTQNATSWGYFDPISHSWNDSILGLHEFPTYLLPKVLKSGSLVGTTKFDWLGIPQNASVLVASGDMQCATYANLRQYPKDAVLNISTSLQLSILMEENFTPPKTRQAQNRTTDFFPFFDDRYLLVATGLNGGNVLQCLVRTLKNIVYTMTNIEVTDEHVWHKMFDSYRLKSPNCNSDDKIIVKPTLLGERHHPNEKASITNISRTVDISELIEGFCEGIIDNALQLMSVEYMKSFGVQRLIGTGTALTKNPVLKDILDKKLDIPVIYTDGSDADVGAAWMAYSYYKHSHFRTDI